MSRIVYLFGAGASCGKRSPVDENFIFEGLPIVKEFPIQINALIARIKDKDTESNSRQKATLEEKQSLLELLDWLRKSCEKHDTVDTYAKKLWLTQKDTNYKKLKLALSAFLTLEQLFHKPDSRYDTFFANILGSSIAQLPKEVTILSWNYDCQFELAFSNYFDQRNLNSIWDFLNINGKTTSRRTNDENGFSIIKLNGTAISFKEENLESSFHDPFFNREVSEIAYVVRSQINNVNIKHQNALSFAWEGTDPNFFSKIETKVNDAEILVVIGYSFPYFNREVDRKIIRNMPNLRKVYIQDPSCEDVKESFEATLSEDQLRKVEAGQIKIVPRKSTQQFLIPNEM